MTPRALSEIRQAVCAVGWIDKTSAEFYADLKRAHFEIEGTGFLVAPDTVLTCENVVASLLQIKQKRGPRLFECGVQFVFPTADGGADMKTVFRAFTIAHRDERIDIALLKIDGDPIAVAPVTIVPEDYVPSVGEGVGLCGYAHGSVLLRRGKYTYRFGPVVQTGVVAALSPFDAAQPEAAILDLVTGPAASGSPIFRQATGEILGFLIEGQVKQGAALSVARLTYCDATTGALVARLVGFEATRVDRSSNELS